MFNSEQFKNKVKSLCSENNTVREILDFFLFQKIKVPIPPLLEQQKVIEELEKVKENLKNAQQINK